MTFQILIQAALLIGVLGVCYFVLVRPQQLRLRRHANLMSNLRPGDRVATSGGLVGKIVSFESDQLLTIETGDG